MPELRISIGGREFTVACQDGEEHFLKAAASLLDTEATALTEQIGRMPEARMLLMAGLMLADRTAGLEERQSSLETQLGQAQSRIAELEGQPAREVEVPMVPASLKETLAELAARAEAVADAVEETAAR